MGYKAWEHKTLEESVSEAKETFANEREFLRMIDSIERSAKAEINVLRSAVDDFSDNALKISLLSYAEENGYGFTMQETVRLWRLKIGNDDHLKGSNFVIGCCEQLTISCGCENEPDCHWCCGCGWLTRHVKAIKDGNLNETL